uniref:Prokineticin 1 n=1 Tax=Strigops habroptila TaxID=2489341 RepID=A0A672UZ66_STRHB
SATPSTTTPALPQNLPSSTLNGRAGNNKLFSLKSPACERDPQCGSGTCCAVSLWLRGLRMCTPLGQEGDECHPFSHKVPFLAEFLDRLAQAVLCHMWVFGIFRPQHLPEA